MDVHLRDLRYFIAVAEELNFTRAAGERLFISQPALSKQIRQLERDLGVTLFKRDRRTVVLTEAGETMLTQARLVLAQWEQAQRAVAAEDATLTVGFQTRIGRGIVPRVTAAMAELLPDSKLLFRQVSWRDPTAGLAGAEVDIAIAWLPVPDTSRLSWRVVASEPRWVALPAGHRLAAQATIPLAALDDEPFIALPAAAGPQRRFWLATAERAVTPRVAAEAETAEETFEAVAAGVGIAFLAAGNAETYRRDDVVCRPVAGLSPSELAVVWRAHDRRPAIRLFVDACQRCLCGEAISSPRPSPAS